jgi:hypothetical protein
VKIYDLYGSKSLSIAQLRAAVEAALAAPFVLHDSSYRGGDYFFAGDLRGETLVVQRNRIAGSGEDIEFAKPAFADYAVILEVNASTRSDQIRTRLAEIQGLDFLLRRTI